MEERGIIKSIKQPLTDEQLRASAVISINSDFALGANIAGTSDVLVLAIQRFTGTTETFYAAMNWEETN